MNTHLDVKLTFVKGKLRYCQAKEMPKANYLLEQFLEDLNQAKMLEGSPSQIKDHILSGKPYEAKVVLAISFVPMQKSKVGTTSFEGPLSKLIDLLNLQVGYEEGYLLYQTLQRNKGLKKKALKNNSLTLEVKIVSK